MFDLNYYPIGKNYKQSLELVSFRRKSFTLKIKNYE